MLTIDYFNKPPKLKVEEVKLSNNVTYVKELLAEAAAEIEAFAYFDEKGNFKVNSQKYKFALIARSLCDKDGNLLFEGIGLAEATEKVSKSLKAPDATLIEHRAQSINLLDKDIDDLAGKS